MKKIERAIKIQLLFPFCFASTFAPKTPTGWLNIAWNGMSCVQHPVAWDMSRWNSPKNYYESKDTLIAVTFKTKKFIHRMALGKSTIKTQSRSLSWSSLFYLLVCVLINIYGSGCRKQNKVAFSLCSIHRRKKKKK